MVVKQLVAKTDSTSSDPPPQPVSFGRQPSNCRLSRNKRTRSVSMFTRTVEVTTKSGKAKELSHTINDQVLPILKKQTGFVDETVLVSDTESTRVLGLSFWNSKEDAERYHREQYPKIQEMLKPLIEAEPVVRTFDVHTSTTHRIASGKAA